MATTQTLKTIKQHATPSESKTKPFNVAELGIGTLLCLLVDGTSALLELIPAIGYLPAAALRAGANFGTTFWIIAKRGNARLERQLAKQAAGLIPFLPAVTAAFVTEAIIHNKEAKGGHLPLPAGKK